MKKIFCFFIASLLLFSCQETAVEKPDNLIDEEVMENILYDLALLEAIKTNNPASLEKKNITASTYIYDKYDIDSLQFVNSNHYYASDVHNYLKMYQRVEERLASEKTKIDTILAQKAKKVKPKQPKPLKSKDDIKHEIKLKEKIGQKN